VLNRVNSRLAAWATGWALIGVPGKEPAFEGRLRTDGERFANRFANKLSEIGRYRAVRRGATAREKPNNQGLLGIRTNRGGRPITLFKTGALSVFAAPTPATVQVISARRIRRRMPCAWPVRRVRCGPFVVPVGLRGPTREGVAFLILTVMLLAPTQREPAWIVLRIMSRRFAGSTREALIIQGNLAQQAQHDLRV
jgi:hypothetical protein